MRCIATCIPIPSTYDEVTNGGIGTALAIKTLDTNALTSGPVIDYWWNYFYSKQDIENGWSDRSPCYQPWSNPTDRAAHGGVPMIVYYLQQMASNSNTYGVRLLDYLTIHAYVAANYNGSSVAFTTAGDTGEQQARMNSTRALWDPTYTDPNFPQPNYSTDSNYTSNCTVPLQAPQIIPMMHSWLTSGWTGTSYAAPWNLHRRVQLRRNRVDQRCGHAGRCSRHLRQVRADHGSLLADNNTIPRRSPATWRSQSTATMTATSQRSAIRN